MKELPHIPLAESGLSEITLLILIHDKQCNHTQHYLFRITTLLVFRYYSIHQVFFFSFRSFSFPVAPVNRHSGWNIPEAAIKLEVSAGIPINSEFGKIWKNGKSIFLKNSRYKMILHFIHYWAIWNFYCGYPNQHVNVAFFHLCIFLPKAGASTSKSPLQHLLRGGKER